MTAREHVRLPDELRTRLETTAAERGVTKSDILREALEEFLEAGPRAIDDDAVLSVLAKNARTGNVAAARELLRHRRWQAENPEGEFPEDPFAELDALGRQGARDDVD